jgi:hypothetical protein
MAASPGPRQEEAIVLNRPADPPVDDAAWERIRKGYSNDKQRFVRLLTELDQRRVDPALDSPSDVLSKRKEVRALLESHQRATLHEMTPGELMILNVVQLRNECSPRLSGRVLKVGDGGAHADLVSALPHIKPGDTVQLAKGAHTFGEGLVRARLAFSDVAFTGSGGDTCTLNLDGRHVNAKTPWLRVQFENLKLVSPGGEFIRMREGSVHLRHCRLAVGSGPAVFAVDSRVFVEECQFDGDSGRPGGSEGNALDLRGDNLLFVRNSKFVNYREILRATFPVGFDACVSEKSSVPHYGILPYPEGSLYVRRNKIDIYGGGREAIAFDRTSDDPEFIEHACGLRPEADAATLKLAASLEIARNLPYWIGLIRHERPEVREKAASKVEALTGRKVFEAAAVDPMTPDEVEKSLGELADDDIRRREAATERLLKAGESIRDPLRDAVDNRQGEAKARAQELLERLDHAKKWRTEIAFSAQIKWFEENRSRLVWDEKSVRYSVRP